MRTNFATSQTTEAVGRRVDTAKATKYKIIGALVFVVGMAIAFLEPFSYAKWVGIGIHVGGAFLFHRGRSYGLVDAFDLLREDARDPIVYIRSFNSELLLDSITKQQAGLLPLFFSPTIEEQLAVAMSEIGPFVALASPRDTAPEFGAARGYVGSSEWQKTIASWIERAQFVVISLGDSNNFWWEVERAVQLVGATKVAFILPLTREGFEKIRVRFQQIFGKAIPEPGKFSASRLSLGYFELHQW